MAEKVVGHPGRYDDIAMRALKEAEAKGVLLLVLEGKRGFGMSLSTRPEVAVELNMRLPELLRVMADMVEAGRGPDGARLTQEDPPPSSPGAAGTGESPR